MKKNNALEELFKAALEIKDFLKDEYINVWYTRYEVLPEEKQVVEDFRDKIEKGGMDLYRAALEAEKWFDEQYEKLWNPGLRGAPEKYKAVAHFYERFKEAMSIIEIADYEA